VATPRSCIVNHVDILNQKFRNESLIGNANSVKIGKFAPGNPAQHPKRSTEEVSVFFSLSAAHSLFFSSLLFIRIRFDDKIIIFFIIIIYTYTSRCRLSINYYVKKKKMYMIIEFICFLWL
jgi:hypothetical protein